MARELTFEEQSKIKEYTIKGKCVNNISKQLGLPILNILEFLKTERIYKYEPTNPHPNKKPYNPEVIKRSVNRHKGLSLNNLAQEANYTCRESPRQWMIKHNIFDQWKKDRKKREELKRNISFSRKNLAEMTSHLNILDHERVARLTGDTYCLEVLEKKVIVDGRREYWKLDHLQSAIDLLKAYDIFVQANARLPKYREISQAAPGLVHAQITTYLSRAGRELFIFHRSKRKVNLP